MSFQKSAADHASQDAGLRLRMLRMFMGKSRRSLAEAVGVSPAQIEDFENGSGRIGAHLLAQLSAELNVPHSFFLDTVPATARLRRPIP